MQHVFFLFISMRNVKKAKAISCFQPYPILSGKLKYSIIITFLKY